MKKRLSDQDPRETGKERRQRCMWLDGQRKVSVIVRSLKLGANV